jgi:hypothetical protein
MLFELPSGERKLTVSAATELCPIASPDGSRLVYREGRQDVKLVALPSGQVIRTLRTPDLCADLWVPDGRHLLLYDSLLSVQDAESGNCIGQIDSDLEIFGFATSGSGFVCLMKDRWALLVHSFDPAVPDAVVPLPGPSAHDPQWADKPPPNGSVSIDRPVLTGDGSAVFVHIRRHQQDGEKKDRERLYLARWDRTTQKWSEIDLGPIVHPVGPATVPTLYADASGRFVATDKRLNSSTLESERGVVYARKEARP